MDLTTMDFVGASASNVVKLVLAITQHSNIRSGQGAGRYIQAFLKGGLVTAGHNLPFLNLYASGEPRLRLRVQRYLRREPWCSWKVVILDHFTTRS